MPPPNVTKGEPKIGSGNRTKPTQRRECRQSSNAQRGVRQCRPIEFEIRIDRKTAWLYTLREQLHGEFAFGEANSLFLLRARLCAQSETRQANSRSVVKKPSSTDDGKRKPGRIYPEKKKAKKDKKKNKEISKNGIGLENIKKRLEMLYPQRYFLEVLQEGKMFKVNLKITL